MESDKFKALPTRCVEWGAIIFSLDARTGPHTPPRLFIESPINQQPDTMSFGFSLSDVSMLVKGLGRLISALKNEAVDGFRKYMRTYQQFVDIVQRLLRTIHSNDLQTDSDIASAIRHIEKLLRRYFRRISEFEPHLGPRRVKRSLLGAITKLKWAGRANLLNGLRQDLDRELGLLYLLIATKPR